MRILLACLAGACYSAACMGPKSLSGYFLLVSAALVLIVRGL